MNTSHGGVEPLRSQNIMIGGHRTSMRLEPSMWDALEDIGRREGMTVNRLCTQIKERIEEQARRKGIKPEDADVTLTSAVRVFIASYYRRACTEDGHQRAGHGGSDPFVGTPFELPSADDNEGAKTAVAAGGSFPAPGPTQAAPARPGLEA
ncbi:putative DNA-binding ribbon-helix-helix protein [Azospirillum lipoferum]|uniref:ribbon-helix-helix domain-containing protein n=1 Tax=Azospirillum TaxID=191 RepID=UPI001FE9AE77|nr:MULTISPECIES: ribbon-helix-helix domain-containing protein [Azospirillum]MCP1610184.1 putative DNA-binding ribbon-helix-helix protein [Azospirillum lipoferum]MDW5534323.1 ribbon-helix-helix domain-containing protein [Azospirillum sp. NL1]